MIKLRLKKEHILYTLLVVSVLTVSVVVWMYAHLSKNIRILSDNLAVTQVELTETHNTLSEIISGSEELRNKLSEETQLRLLAEESEEEARERFEQEIVTIQAGLKEQQEAVNASDISRIISEWSPRVARLNCAFLQGEKT